MEIVTAATVGTAAMLTGLHMTSLLLAWRRQARSAEPRDVSVPPVTIIRPLCGVEPFVVEALGSTFRLDPAPAEIIFCVDAADDPVIPLVRELMDAHPTVRTRLLIGRDRISANPKLNNLAKGWREAGTAWIAFIDSNVVLSVDALARLFDRVTPETGMVCAPPIGSRPDGFAAELESAFLNTHQARWQSAADAVGYGFAQGKVMLFERALIEAAGGLEVLGHEPAEDAASTNVVRGAGRVVRLAERFFDQPLGKRDLKVVWNRQVRWAQLRRASFPRLYTLEILTGFWPAALAAAAAALMLDVDVLTAVGALAVVWYGSEAVMARACGWPDRAWMGLVRDTLLPAVWVSGWLKRDFVWQGHAMRAERPRPETVSPA